MALLFFPSMSEYALCAESISGSHVPLPASSVFHCLEYMFLAPTVVLSVQSVDEGGGPPWVMPIINNFYMLACVISC